MNAALENVAVLQGIEHQINERQHTLADIQSTLSFKHTRMRLLKKQSKRLRFKETIRKPSKDFELWSIGLIIIGVAAAVLASWLTFYLLNASFGIAAVCIGLASALAGLFLFRLLFVPRDAALRDNIVRADQELSQCQSESHALEQRELAIKGEISRLEGQKRQLVESQKYKAELLLTQNWKAMRDSEWEQFLAEIFVVLGGHVTKTGASGDQGVDLVVEFSGVRTAIQAKGYYNAVGNAAVQQAVAGKAMYNCRRCAVITNSRFTKSAHAIAHDFRTAAGAGIMVPEGGPKDGRAIEAQSEVVQRGV